ncbi:hypothetical protein V8D89_012544 [Ganoderma adspersum]
MNFSLSMVFRPGLRNHCHGATAVCGGGIKNSSLRRWLLIHPPSPPPNSRSLASIHNPKKPSPTLPHLDAPNGPGRRRGQPAGRGARSSSPSTRGKRSPGPFAGRTEVSGKTGGFRTLRNARGGGGVRGGPPAIFAEGQPLEQDPRLAGPELSQLVQGFGPLRFQPVMPLRPSWGTLGKPGVLRTNFFAVHVPPGAAFFEYEVAISPKEQVKGDRRARVMQLVEQAPEFAPYVAHVAHDRSQRLISARKLPQPLEVPIEYREEGRTDNPNPLKLTVEFKFLSELKMADLDRYISGKPKHRGIDTQPHISALNLILQQYAQKHGVRVSRNKYFFPSPSSEHDRLSLGIEAVHGFFISVRRAYKQLLANVNLCYTAFYVPGNLAQRMDEFRAETGGAMPESFANGLKVSTTHLGYTRTYVIHGIMMDKTAREERFDCQEFGGMISVEEFFRRKYSITLRRHSDLPLINVSADSSRPVYLPAEICEIVPGPYRGKLNAEQTAAMIKVSCNQPAFNGKAITSQGFTDLGLRSNAPGAALGPFGISVSRNMQVVPYRILPPPTISYDSAVRPRVQDAGWNMTDVKFHAGADMTNWAVLLVNENPGNKFQFKGPDDPELRTFLQTFAAKCATSGIMSADKLLSSRIWSVDLPPVRRDTPTRSKAIAAIATTLEDTLNKDPNQKPSFVLVLLSRADKLIYQGIKQLADVRLGVHTVHMLLPTARGTRANMQAQYFSNVALKVNAKLGGTNHKVDAASMRWLTTQKTMMMGIDVTHPGAASVPGTPSLAAVVASVDEHFVQFPASFALQKPDWNKDSKEMVEDLTRMTMERLQLYKQKNGKLPDRIIVFRDGVSDTQYDQVIKHELPRLQAAFKQISPERAYKPKLSIIVCGKRHNARFWAPDSEHATKNGNTLPGTVVDKGITDVYLFDFYLQAHDGLQGQAKATHYVVVYDENKLDADTIQQGTHTVSYLCARATKAVSLVPAAYYADIACGRGREYLNVLMNVENGSRAHFKVDREQTYKTAVNLWGEGVHKDLKDTMFYI